MDGVWYLNDRALRAIDAATGQLLGSFEVDEDAASRPLAVAEGMVFVQTWHAFHALHAAAGDEIWSLGADWDLSSSIMVVGEVQHAHSLSGYLHTLDTRTGEPIWSVDIGSHRGGDPSSFQRVWCMWGYLPTTWTEGEEPSSSVNVLRTSSLR